MKKNVLLIMVDQMRKDCMSCVGHPIVETPYLDMMKHDGALFSSAYSAVPSCIAARTSVLTGLTQNTHGRVGYEDKVPWTYKNTLAEEFTRAGYHTQCVGKMHVYPTRNLCGFHNVILHDGYLHHCRNYNIPAKEQWQQCDDYYPWLRQQMGMDADIIDSGLDCNSWVARPWPYAEHLHPTNWTVSQSIDFLRRRDPDKPFFLMTSFVRPHSPLDPPQAYYDQYINQDIPLPPIGDWANKYDEDGNGLDVNCNKGIINETALKRAHAAYYGLITHIDHQIGRLVQTLAEYGELENTIILFVSDHGDLLGDHNLFRKALPYEGSSGVPFIIYDPGNILNFKHNIVIDKPVELRDIMPTLLDAVGIDIPESVEGKSVLPLLRDTEIDWRDYIHGEHSYSHYSNHYITNGKEKYIWYSQTGEEQYFDLINDPKELHNLLGDENHAFKIDFWRNILIKELEYREEGYSDGKQLLPGKTPKATLHHLLEKTNS